MTSNMRMNDDSAALFHNVQYESIGQGDFENIVTGRGGLSRERKSELCVVSLSRASQPSSVLIVVCSASGTDSHKERCLFEGIITEAGERVGVGSNALLLRLYGDMKVLSFPRPVDCTEFCNRFDALRSENSKADRTVKAIASGAKLNGSDYSEYSQYFYYYGLLQQQQNMLQDLIRTGTYQKAFLLHSETFKDAVVVDVGCGTGILSFFAVQAGARKVYAIEASNMADNARKLVKDNKLDHIITVIESKVEDIELPEKIDIVVSEPMGIGLLNERMLESFIYARKWLKDDGHMFPTTSHMHFSPFTDSLLYLEQFNKTVFWSHKSFFGVDLSSLNARAFSEYFSQPVVDAFDSRILLSTTVAHYINFQEVTAKYFEKVEIPMSFVISNPSTIHGIALWFDVLFTNNPSENKTKLKSDVRLSTGPFTPPTHWFQMRCLFPNPPFATPGSELSGVITFYANSRQSYDIHLNFQLRSPGNSGTVVHINNVVNMKEPLFRYSGGMPTASNAYTPDGAALSSESMAVDSEALDISKGVQNSLFKFQDESNSF
eukprot:Nk52_evm102s914 gene=Nk52_evmTU102s914